MKKRYLENLTKKSVKFVRDTMVNMKETKLELVNFVSSKLPFLSLKFTFRNVDNNLSKRIYYPNNRSKKHSINVNYVDRNIKEFTNVKLKKKRNSMENLDVLNVIKWFLLTEKNNTKNFVNEVNNKNKNINQVFSSKQIKIHTKILWEELMKMRHSQGP